jgi:hypothetical protein
VRCPSGKLTLIDIAQLNLIGFDVLASGLVSLTVPSSSLMVTGAGRQLSDDRRRVDAIWIAVVADSDPNVANQARVEVGQVAIDMAHLLICDAHALANWRTEETNDDKYDVIFWGKDASGLATLLNAPDHRDGYGWTNLSATDAELRSSNIGRRKQDQRWQLTLDVRVHNDYYRVAEAARREKARCATVAHGDCEHWIGLNMATGVFPVSAVSNDKGALLGYLIEFRAQ